MDLVNLMLFTMQRFPNGVRLGSRRLLAVVPREYSGLPVEFVVQIND